ncbi:MAG: hypothetical protein JNL60_09090 [Bacteroidia bacterium]|nr:hypothetical protein [Bacteroidia bacterium]
MKKVRSFFTIVMIVAGPVLSWAAPGPPTTGTTTSPTCWPPPCIPVDGGIGFLIAAGAIYGAKKIYSSRKKEQGIS